MHPLDNVRILEFPGVTEPSRGTLTVLENLHYDRLSPSGASENCIWPIKRVFYIYGVPEGAERGGHAHHTNTEILVCLSGSLDILLTDGISERKLRLDDPTKGLLIPPDVWNRMSNYAPGTVLLVLCSEKYTTKGYFNEFEEFKNFIKTNYPG